MRIGIFGSAGDPQCQALEQELRGRGVKVVLVESQGLNRGLDHAFDGEGFRIGGADLSDVRCWYLRHIMAPLPPAFRAEEDYHLFGDWFVEYANRRERFGFQLSMLLTLGLRGVPVVNPPEHGSVVQLKPFQLAAAREVGLDLPRTLITNDPEQVRAFREETGAVVYKPSMGGGLCRELDDESMEQLDLIVRAPVTFQERVEGDSLRATFLGQELVSCVTIPTSSLDYRADPDYQAGRQRYEPVDLDAGTIERCHRLLRHCGLVFCGVDFMRRPDGSLVFLEANSSPIYLDVEYKTGVPITSKLADYLQRLGANPEEWCPDGEPRARKSFVDYALPFAPDRTVHSPGPPSDAPTSADQDAG